MSLIGRGSVYLGFVFAMIFAYQNCGQQFTVNESKGLQQPQSQPTPAQPSNPPSPANLPYSLPASGQVVAIGTNNAFSIIPTGESWTQGAWGYSLFDSYGGGAFVPKYSAYGAYVIAGSGGHAHPDNNGAAVFDFATGTWERLDNTNGVPRTTYPFYYEAKESNGAPWYEILGTTVPLPGHPYANLAYMPDGDRGSVIYVTRAAIAREAIPSQSSHRFDLATRKWTRATEELGTRTGVEGDSVWDEARNRWWYINTEMHYYTSLTYLDHGDMKWKSIGGMTGYPPTGVAGYGRVMLHDGLLIRNNGPGKGLWMIDPDNVPQGWVKLTVSGTLPSSQDRWTRFSDGNWYGYDGSGKNVITRIQPPADPKAGTWVIDSITLSGDTMGTKSARVGEVSNLAHYTRFFYVPNLDCLAWIPGSNQPVYLLRP